MTVSNRFGEYPFPSDILSTSSGRELEIRFFAHASLALSFCGRQIYVDPVNSNADYAAQPRADLILFTHAHYDHFDAAAVEALGKDDTSIVLTEECFASLGRGTVLHNGDSVDLGYASVHAVPAYNTTAGHTDFHPEGRDNGYILTLDGTRIYIAGDGEPTPQMLALRDIDIAFLPVNQPYTMTEQQAARAVAAIRPKIFYPYHYGQVEHRTDLELLEKLVGEIPGVEMRIRPME